MRLGRIALGVLVVAAVAASIATTAPTTAAWTDPALFTLTASTGTWDDGEDPLNPFEPGEDTTNPGAPSWQIADQNTSGSCATFTVSSTSATPVAWSVIWKLDQAPVWGSTTATLYYQGTTQVDIVRNGSTATITGVTNGTEYNPAYNNALLDVSRAPLTVIVCVSTATTPPPADPSWYTVTQQPSGTWSRTEACVDLTATGNQDLETNPYYFGWQAALDLSEPIAYVESQGGAPNYVRFTPDPSNGYYFTTDPATIAPPPASYEITSGQLDAIKGTQSVTIEACVEAL